MIKCKCYDKNTEPIELKDDTLINCTYYDTYRRVKRDCEECHKCEKLYVLFFKAPLRPIVILASYDKYDVINEYNESVGKNKEYERIFYIKEFEEVE